MVKLGLVKRECVATSIHITVRCTPTISEGEFVKEGEIIGFIGGSARGKDYAEDKNGKRISGTAVHLHYELWKINDNGVLEGINPIGPDGIPIDPQQLLNIDVVKQSLEESISLIAEIADGLFDSLESMEPGSSEYNSTVKLINITLEGAKDLDNQLKEHLERTSEDNGSDDSSQGDSSEGNKGSKSGTPSF